YIYSQYISSKFFGWCEGFICSCAITLNRGVLYGYIMEE
ncbi:unnamed protein product, partial [marine sediment metagenome]